MACGALALTAWCAFVGCEEDDMLCSGETDGRTSSAEISTGHDEGTPEPSDDAAQTDIPFSAVPLLYLLDQEETVVIRNHADWEADRKSVV